MRQPEDGLSVAEAPASEENSRAPSAPRWLGPAGRAQWRALHSEYDFAPGEVALVAEYCANVDMITRLRAELDKGDLIVQSPQAGPVVARPVAEIRACQGEMRKLADQLRFRELAVEDEAERFPALRSAGLAHARPVTGKRDPRSHRRAV